MKSLLSCLLLLAGCVFEIPISGSSLIAPPDAAEADAMSIGDGSSPPDMSLLCAFGQVPLEGACVCRMESPVSCPVALGGQCCSAMQTCLSGGRCSAPPGRMRTAMAFDPLRGRTVVVAGRQEERNRFADLHELDSTSWFQPAMRDPWPTPRSGHTLTFDGAGGRLLLFGGDTALGRSAETWTWDGSAFTRLTPTRSPRARELHAAAYDSKRKRIVLYGGTIQATQGVESVNETWEWDGMTWEQRMPPKPPKGREGHAMAYDAKRERTVLFGGYIGDGDVWSQATYLWDGERWSDPPIMAGDPFPPPPRAYTALAYDEAREEVVLFGGATTPILGNILGDTWVWDGTRWTRRTPGTSPPARTNHAMVYDAARRQVLLYGGVNTSGFLSDVWAWDGTRWTQLY